MLFVYFRLFYCLILFLFSVSCKICQFFECLDTCILHWECVLQNFYCIISYLCFCRYSFFTVLNSTVDWYGAKVICHVIEQSPIPSWRENCSCSGSLRYHLQVLGFQLGILGSVVTGQLASLSISPGRIKT